MGRVGRFGQCAAASFGLLWAGCSDGPAGPELDTSDARSETRIALDGAVGSIEQLAFVALSGLASADTARLQGIVLTELEHNELVWPELPASAPEVNFPVDFAWSNIQLRNRRAIGRLVARYNGHRLSLHDVACHEEPEVFSRFRVLKDCRVTFVVDGTIRETRQIFRYVLDWGGQFKIFRYYDSD